MADGQSCSTSFFEVLTSTVRGFPLPVRVQRLLFPALGQDLGYAKNMVVASAFTTVSILRGYTVRRLVNALRDQRP